MVKYSGRALLYCFAYCSHDSDLACYASAFQVVNEPADAHCPVVEMSTRSKLSCLSWNKYTKNHIASSDYDGIVTVWDVTTRQVNQYFC